MAVGMTSDPMSGNGSAKLAWTPADDPWLRKVVEDVLRAYLVDPSRMPPEFAVLGPEQQIAYLGKFREGLFTNAEVLRTVQGQRLKAFTEIQARIKALDSFIDHLDPKAQPVARRLAAVVPTTLTHHDLVRCIGPLQVVEEALRRAARSASSATMAAEKDKAAEGKETRTALQRLQAAEASFDRLGWARSIGNRIRLYRAAVRTGSPSSMVMARYLWEELGGSLYGWRAKEGPEALEEARTRSLESVGTEAEIADLRAFVNEGFDPSGNIRAEWVDRPQFLGVWNPAWGHGSPSGVALWVYEAQGESLRLDEFLGSFPSKDLGITAAQQILGLEGGASPRPSWALTGSSLDELVPADGFLESGNLYLHRETLERALEDFKQEADGIRAEVARLQARLGELEGAAAEAEERGDEAATSAADMEAVSTAQAMSGLLSGIDPLYDLKVLAAEAEVSILRARIGDGVRWDVISGDLTPRDPWIPLHVLSAFASHYCQFPWPVWAAMYRHPDSDMSGTYTGDPAQAVGGKGRDGDGTQWYWPTYYESEREFNSSPRFLESSFAGSYDPTERKAENGRILSRPIHYKATLKEVRAGASWSRLTKLTAIGAFKPWRLEVVHLAPPQGGRAGIFAYRTFDWFPHTLAEGEDYAVLETLYRLPNEGSEAFKASLVQENGPDDAANVVRQLILGVALAGTTIRVPRVIPNDLFMRKGDTEAGLKVDAKTGAVTIKSLGGNTEVSRNAERVERGVSPIAMLFIGYLNNDYRAYPRGLGGFYTDRQLLYELFTGTSVPAFADDSEERALTQTLYKKGWREWDGYLSDKNIPPTEADRAAAEDPAYTGILYAGIIPKDSTAARSLLPRGDYQFTQGTLSRICAKSRWVHPATGIPWSSRGKAPGNYVRSKLTAAEFTFGVPQVQGPLLRIAAEVKARAKLRRIEDFQEAVAEAFKQYMSHDRRAPWRADVLRAYNAIWSGYLDAVDHAPQRYSSVQRLGTPHLSTQIVRWQPKPPDPVRPKASFHLYDYQSDAALRLDDKGGGLLALDVGLGKSITVIGTCAWMKQQGKVRRPMFIVPRTIKLKWWKEIRMALPHWNIAVLGMTLKRPRTADDLKRSPEARARFQEYTRIIAKLFKKAGYGAGGPEGAAQVVQAAEAIALRLVIEGGTAKALLPDAVWNVADEGWQKGPGIRRLPPMEPTWCDDTPEETTIKLKAFRDGAYDCIVTDPFAFKNIAIDPRLARDHLTRTANMRYMLWRKAFSKGAAAAGSRLRNRLEAAMAFLTLGPGEGRSLLMRTNGGKDELWSWVPNPKNEAYPYDAAVRSWVSRAMVQYGGSADAGFWKQMADTVFGQNLELPRTELWPAAQEVWKKLLWDDPPTWAVVDSGSAAAAEGAFSEVEPLEIPFDGTTQEVIGSSAPWPIEHDDPYVTYRGSEALSLPLLYPAVDVVHEPDAYPDGAAISGSSDAYVQPDYASGWKVNLRINRSRVYDGEGEIIDRGGFPADGRLPAAQNAKAAAEAMAAFLNAHRSDFPVLRGTAKVVPYYPVIQKTPQDKSTQGRGPDADDRKPYTETLGEGPTARSIDRARYGPITSLKRAASLVRSRSLIPALYFTQASPWNEPEVLWCHDDPAKDLGVDCLIIDEAHQYKGLFSPYPRGKVVAYLGGGMASSRAWILEYMASGVKARGGKVILLTATPAKQSPLDFYNIIQFLGAPGLSADDRRCGGTGGDVNLFSGVDIDTAEQFVSRFVQVEDKVVINAKGEASRQPAASAFINLKAEFGQVFRRYSERKTVPDVPMHRGRTAAEGGPRPPPGYSPAAEGGRWHRPAIFIQDPAALAAEEAKAKASGATEEEVETILAEVPYTRVLVPGLDPGAVLGPADVPKAVLRITTGDSVGNYRLRSAEALRDGEGHVVGAFDVLPSLDGPATSTRDQRGDGWAIYVGGKTPTATLPAKPLVSMDPAQAAVYGAYQHALARMYIDNLSSYRVEIPGRPGEIIEVDRATIFSRLSRVAMHPDLEELETRGIGLAEAMAAGRGDDDETEEDEEAEEIETEEEKDAEGIGDRYAYGLATCVDPRLDALYEDNDPRNDVLELPSLVGMDEKTPGDPGSTGLKGSIPVLNPEYAVLRAMRKKIRASRSAWIRGGGTEADWRVQPSIFGPRPSAGTGTKRGSGKGKKGAKGAEGSAEAEAAAGTEGVSASGASAAASTRVPGTNGEDLDRIDSAFDTSLSMADRGARVSAIWGPEVPVFKTSKKGGRVEVGRGGFFAPSAVKPALNKKVTTFLAEVTVNPAERGEVLRAEPMSSRTLAIADRVVGQAIADMRSPAMAGVRCGSLIFADNLFFQAWLTIAICRFYATAKAAHYEVCKYNDAGRKAAAKAAGEAAEAAGQGREAIQRAQVTAAHAWAPDPGKLATILGFYFGPLGPRKDASGAEIPEALGWAPYYTVRAILQDVFPGTDIVAADVQEFAAYPGDDVEGLDPKSMALRKVLRWAHRGYALWRYSGARTTAPFWFVLAGEEEAPARPSFDLDTTRAKYANWWQAMARRITVMNSKTAPADSRELLAEGFNGEYELEDIEDAEGRSQGEKLTVLREPIFDVVIANNVAYEGIDLQARTCRVIHADLPWTPADFVQRNGRAVRQGNIFKAVDLLVYVTEDTVDWYRVQSIERKRAWLDTALDAASGTYELTDNEKELLELAVRSVAAKDRPAVAEIVGRKLQAIDSEKRNKYFSRVTGKVGAANDAVGKLIFARAAASGQGAEGAYAKVIEESVDALRAALREAEAMGGKAVGGSRIYGWQYKPSYFDVCNDALRNERRAQPNVNPRLGEPRAESPAVPLVEGTVYGGFVWKDPPASASGRSTWNDPRPAKPENALEVPETEGLEVWDPAEDRFRPVWFVPILLSGRVGTIDAARPFGASSALGRGAAGFGPLTVGVLPLTRVSYLTMGQWTPLVASKFNDLLNNSLGELPDAVSLSSSKAPMVVHNRAMALRLPLDTVLQHLDARRRRVERDYGFKPTGSLERWTTWAKAIGASEYGFKALETWAALGYVDSEVIDRDEAALHAAALQALTEVFKNSVPDRWGNTYNRIEDREKAADVYFPFVEGSELRAPGPKLMVIRGHRFVGTDGEKLRKRFLDLPMLAAERIASGEALPAIDDAEAEQAAAEVALKEWKEEVKSTEREVKKAQAAREKATQVLGSTPTPEAAQEALALARQKAEVVRETMDDPTGPLPPKMRAILDAAEAEAPKLTAAYEAAKAAADEAVAALRAAQEAALTAEENLGGAQRAMEAAESRALLARAAHTKLILPSLSGLQEFLALARSSEAILAGQSTNEAGRIAISDVAHCCASWFSGFPQPQGQQDWWASAEGAEPTTFHRTYLVLKTAEAERRKAEDAAATARAQEHLFRPQGGAPGAPGVRRKIAGGHGTITFNTGRTIVSLPKTKAGVLQVGAKFVYRDDPGLFVYRVIKTEARKDPDSGQPVVAIDAEILRSLRPEEKLPEDRGMRIVLDSNDDVGMET